MSGPTGGGEENEPASRRRPSPPPRVAPDVGVRTRRRLEAEAEATRRRVPRQADAQRPAAPPPTGRRRETRKERRARDGHATTPTAAVPTVTEADPDAGRDTGTRRILRPRPPVPTGEIVIRGRTRQVADLPPRRTLLGRRYAVVYDVQGPKVRLGVGWFVLAVGALVVGPVGVVPLYSLMAGLAGYQVAVAWREVGSGANPWIAAVGAAGVAASSAWGIGTLGLAVLVFVAVALLLGALEVRHRHPLFEAAGSTIQSGLFVALASAGFILTLRLEIGAAAVLLLFVSAYETGDFLVGSGASSSIEGPIAGIVAMAVVCGVVAVLRVPPFDGPEVFVFGGFAAVGCPLGQLAGSAVLPRADARAGGLRRLDSLLVLGPAWALLVGIYLAQVVSSP